MTRQEGNILKALPEEEAEAQAALVSRFLDFGVDRVTEEDEVRDSILRDMKLSTMQAHPDRIDRLRLACVRLDTFRRR